MNPRKPSPHMPLDTVQPEPPQRGFLANARAVVLGALALAVLPPPPIDLRAFAAEEMEYPASDPMPGPYRPDRFPMWERVFEVLSLDHPADEVTLRGSGQIGKTNLLNIFIVGTMSATAIDVLKVDPTSGAVTEWKVGKLDKMRRVVPAAKALFGPPRKNDAGDSTARVETADGMATLRLVSAQSPSELSGTSRRVVILDDLSKFENTDRGDPERLAVTRARAFPNPKIFRASVAGLRGECRITKAWKRGTQERWHVPCPHCDAMQPLLWENMEPHLREGDPASAEFECLSCGAMIEEKHRTDIVSRGAWVQGNPDGDHPSFDIWSVYFALGKGWSDLVAKWFAVKGDPAGEQTFYNDELGLDYAVATTAPKWEELRDRAENADPGYDLQTVPAGHPMLTMGVDCQGDRVEASIWAFGRDARRAAIEKLVIPHHISTQAAKDTLTALSKATWRMAQGNRISLDRIAIDGGAYTDDVADWVKRFPASRVVMTKGANTDTGPLWKGQNTEQKRSGKIRRRSKQRLMVNVSVLKMGFYGALSKVDPLSRGFVQFARGLGDDFFRQVTAEHRVSRRSSSGSEVFRWEKIDSTQPNEDLDCAIMAELCARLEGWRVMTEAEWDALEAERDIPVVDEQPGLFDSDTAQTEAARIAAEIEAEDVNAVPLWKRAIIAPT